MIEAIENQIESDNPPAAKATFNKLTLVGYEREEILNLMAHVLAVEIDAILEEDRAFNTEWYEAACAHCPSCRRKRNSNSAAAPARLRSCQELPQAATLIYRDLRTHRGILLNRTEALRHAATSGITLGALSSNS